MRNIDGLLSWAEKRIMYRIEYEREIDPRKTWTPMLRDLAEKVGMQPKAVREIISGLTEKGYVQFEPRGRRVHLELIKPLSGQYQLQWVDGSSMLVRAF
jgi:DNA-binding MarR family transcriptional regulator